MVQLGKVQSINSDELWVKSVFNNKHPIYFKHNSNKIFFLDIPTKTWINHEANIKTIFPQFHRVTELDDGSYIITGGQMKGFTVNTVYKFTNSLNDYITEITPMNFPRKAHTAIYNDGIYLDLMFRLPLCVWWI